MVAAVRRGVPIRSVARQFRLGFSTVHRWVSRAQGERLDRVDWSGRPPGPRGPPANRRSRHTEEEVLKLRRELEQTSDLGEYGDVAIRRELVQRGHGQIPSVRTIGRILERRGGPGGRQRGRRPPPARGVAPCLRSPPARSKPIASTSSPALSLKAESTSRPLMPSPFTAA